MIYFIILILLAGCAYSPNEYFPKGDYGDKTKFFTNFDGFICSKCGKNSVLYKVDPKDNILCNDCYRELK